MSKKIRTHYDNLQIAETAGPEVIRGAYRYLSQRWHPDKNPDNYEQAVKNTQAINAAYEVLSDPELRKKHDIWIAEKCNQASKSKNEKSTHKDRSKPSESENKPIRNKKHKALWVEIIKIISLLTFIIVNGLAFLIYNPIHFFNANLNWSNTLIFLLWISVIGFVIEKLQSAYKRLIKIDKTIDIDFGAYKGILAGSTIGLVMFFVFIVYSNVHLPNSNTWSFSWYVPLFFVFIGAISGNLFIS